MNQEFSRSRVDFAITLLLLQAMKILPNRHALLSAALASVFLAACGGGGGVSSTPGPVLSPSPPPSPSPSPAPSPEPTENTDVANLVVDETFETQTSSDLISFDLENGTVLSNSASEEALSISYDASSGSYTLSTETRSATFTPADALSLSYEGERIFEKSTAAKSERLTFVDKTYFTDLETQYVGLGYWQSSISDGRLQDSDLNVFVYGFPSASDALRPTGYAQYRTELFASYAPVGDVPVAIIGAGSLNIDFARSVFSMDAVANRFEYSEGEFWTSGDFYTSGTISSAGLLKGLFSYSPQELGRRNVSGPISGQFYGPDADEVGMIFSGRNSDGDSVIGGLVGFYFGLPEVDMNLVDIERTASLRGGFGTITKYPDGTYHRSNFGPNEGRFGEEERYDDESDPYQRYSRKVEVEGASEPYLYEMFLLKPDRNDVIALTYSSLGHWRQTFIQDGRQYVLEDFGSFGIYSNQTIISAQTGSATYSGVAIGSAVEDGTQYSQPPSLSLSGSVEMNIDFATDELDGWLDLQGFDANGDLATTFDRFEISLLVAGQQLANDMDLQLSLNGEPIGDGDLWFYGPNLEEIGGEFSGAADGWRFKGGYSATRD